MSFMKNVIKISNLRNCESKVFFRNYLKEKFAHSHSGKIRVEYT